MYAGVCGAMVCANLALYTVYVIAATVRSSLFSLSSDGFRALLKVFRIDMFLDCEAAKLLCMEPGYKSVRTCFQLDHTHSVRMRRAYACTGRTTIYIIGASAASPTLVDKTKICLYIYLCLYIYRTCVFRIYIHPAPFVRDAIFPH